MVKRIIENDKYLGTDKYPKLIDDDTFQRANEKRILKATSLCAISDELQEIRKRTYCSECGHGLLRIGGNRKYERWDCKNEDCSRFEYRITDQMIIGAVLIVLNSVISNPALVESDSEICSYVPSFDVIRQQNEINQMTDSARIDYEHIESKLFRLAQMKYDCCTYNDGKLRTAELKALLENREQLNTLDIGLFKSCVSKIWISHFCTIEVELINSVKIKNTTERFGNHEHPSECNDNTGETSDC